MNRIPIYAKNVHCSSIDLMKEWFIEGWKGLVNYSTDPFFDSTDSFLCRPLWETRSILLLVFQGDSRLLSSDSWPEREGLDATSFEQLPFHRAHDEKENDRQTLLYTRLNSFNRARGASWSSESNAFVNSRKRLVILRNANFIINVFRDKKNLPFVNFNYWEKF